MSPSPLIRPDFATFFATDYLAEHRHPVNIALHMIGTLGGLGLIALALTVWPWWAMLAWPLVNVLPGQVGHRLFERNPAVGDLRITRTDYPVYWFLIANHILTARLLTGTLKR
jgi:hypothetical protein